MGDRAGADGVALGRPASPARRETGSIPSASSAGQRCTVSEDWRASYEDPLRATAGERLELTGRWEDWEGHRWVWARSSGGLEGWIPDSLIEGDGGRHRARVAYSAQELTCRRGQQLTRVWRLHGWSWCRSEEGRVGWVPDRNLADPAEGL